ncbi:MAG TPA: glycosyltransferase family 2 protein [Candidatus Baltobacteraceae bacterium]
MLTRNEERVLSRALKSLPAGMPALVLDADSTDRTRQIAAECGAAVLRRAWTDFVDARRFALAQVRTPWALMLDADESLDDGLRAALADAPEDCDGYLVSRTTSFCGRPLRMWTGELLLRLFRPQAVVLEAHPAAGGGAALHERWICAGPVGRLSGTLAHESYPTVASYREKYARYTTIEARGRPAARAGLPAILLRCLARFVWLAIVRGAALDGWRGLYVAWYSAMYPAAVARKARKGA